MESLVLYSIAMIAFVVVALAAGMWIFAAVLAVSIVSLNVINGFSFERIGLILQPVIWRMASSYEIATLPLFIWMAEILFRSRLSDQIFRAFVPWISWLPGRLLHVIVLGCGVFGSVAGTSAATCATMSKIAIPELNRRGYDQKMVIGALASGGTLGILIPPSITMVIYAIAAEVSLIDMFLAGFLPGALLMFLFSAYIMIWAIFNPEKTEPALPPTTLGHKLRATLDLAPTLLLLAFVMGALMTGIATPTETAACGVVGALALSAFNGSLTWQSFRDGLDSTIRITCMVMIILVATASMSSMMALTGIPRAIATTVNGMELHPYMLVVVLTVIYIILGIFLDGASMILLTLPVVLPIISHAGFDLIWFGIFLIIVIEMAELSPPVGFNLFVLQHMTGRDIFYIAAASAPFFLLMIVGIAMITVWPDIVLIAPRLFN
ncbi:MAG: TRAP transporter large permease subunit [Proteobacteria bacterium]|nr:TRAP transporter large permease subunit [Pseudomonadota bacterium]